MLGDVAIAFFAGVPEQEIGEAREHDVFVALGIGMKHARRLSRGGRITGIELEMRVDERRGLPARSSHWRWPVAA